MMGEIGWNFPINAADEWDGFNDSGIEHFRGDPFGNLAREILQNSLDAATGGTVHVAFKLNEVATREIPDLQEFRETIDACCKAAESEGKKAKAFFEHASSLLRMDAIQILTICEQNTTGIAGPCENNTPYYAFVKATGQSKKAKDTSTGSYGIGKYAPFAVSDLRTIFISTIFRDEDAYSQYVQGKAVLMSHKHSEHIYRGTGYWGFKKKCLPITGYGRDVPAWVSRAASARDAAHKLGTTLHVVAFHAGPGWKEKLTASVIENFFGAIVRGQLAVNVEDVEVSESTIREIASDEGLYKANLDRKGEPEHLENAKAYLSALEGSEEILVESHQNRLLGHCMLRIRVGEGLPKQVVMLRNGMFITDQLEGLKRFGDFKEFVAIVECMDDKGNELLRAMEPPRHNDFEPDRLLTANEQRQGRRALKDLSAWVRDRLKRHARDPVSEVTSIDELSDFFGDESGDGRKSKGEEVNPAGKIQIQAQPFRRRRADVREEDGDDDGSGGGAGNGGGGGGGDGGAGDGDGKGTGGGGDGHRVQMPLRNVRALRISETRKQIAFTPEATGVLELRIFEAGADTDRFLHVVQSTKGSVSGGKVTNVSCRQGQRIVLEVRLGANFEGAVKVVGYEV